jgi:hypothetical protein
MPANPKHLTVSPWQRAGKISAGILGGYCVTAAVHLAFASWVNHVNVLITSTFTGFILWAVLMVLAFLAKSGWRVWLLYILLILIFLVIAWMGKTYNPNFLH